MEPVPTVSRRGLCVDLLVLEIKDRRAEGSVAQGEFEFDADVLW